MKDKKVKSIKKPNIKKYYWVTAIFAIVLSGAYVGLGLWSNNYNGLYFLSIYGEGFWPTAFSTLGVIGVFIIPSLITRHAMGVLFDKQKPPTIKGQIWKVVKSIVFSFSGAGLIIVLLICALVRGDVSEDGNWIVSLKDYFYFLGLIFPAFMLSYADALKSSNIHEKELLQRKEEYKQKEYSWKQGILLRDERIEEQKRTIRNHEKREQRLYQTVTQKDKKIESLEEKLERLESENKDLRNQLRQYEQYQPMINLVKKILKK